MLPNRSLWLPPTSGFVPLGSAGALDDEVLEAPARPAVAKRVPIAEERALPDAVAAPARSAPPAAVRAKTWQPPTTLAVRRVEMAVLAAICGYFSMGLVKLLGLF